MIKRLKGLKPFHPLALLPIHRFTLLTPITLLTLSPSSLFAAEKVTFESLDGVQLVGEFYHPSPPLRSTLSRKGRGKKGEGFTLILLHGLASVKEEWNSFAQYLSSKGYGILIYDARGHGKSTIKKSGGSINFQMFFGRGLNSDWGKMIDDLGAAVKFLTQKYKLNPKKIGVGGASLGANVALRLAAKDPQIPFAILLSPGIDYQGITTHEVIEKMGSRPVLLSASPADRYAYQSLKELERIAGTNSPSIPLSSKGKQGEARGSKGDLTILIETENQGHGVQMFRRAKPDAPSPLEVKIFQWMEKIK